jgi:UDP-N-acetylglucosamine kinase
VQFVAGPAALSRHGVLQRYQDQVDALGHGAYCPVPIQERNYAGVLDTAAKLDATVCADRVAVSRRGGTLLYAQDRVGARWVPAASCRAAIEAERARTWTAAEQDWFVAAARQLANRLAPTYLGDLREACVLARPLFTPAGLPTLEKVIDAVTARTAQATAARILADNAARSVERTPPDSARPRGQAPRNPVRRDRSDRSTGRGV